MRVRVRHNPSSGKKLIEIIPTVGTGMCQNCNQTMSESISNPFWEKEQSVRIQKLFFSVEIRKCQNSKAVLFSRNKNVVDMVTSFWHLALPNSYNFQFRNLPIFTLLNLTVAQFSQNGFQHLSILLLQIMALFDSDTFQFWLFKFWYFHTLNKNVFLQLAISSFSIYEITLCQSLMVI